MDPNWPTVSLVKASDCNQVLEQNSYQLMVVSLMYLVTWTRPDFASSVSYVSSFTSSPLKCHYTTVLCLLSRKVLLLPFLCLSLHSLTWTMLHIVIPGVLNLVRLVYSMLVLYPGSLRHSILLPLLQRMQNEWHFLQPPVKQSGNSSHSDNAIMRSP